MKKHLVVGLVACLLLISKVFAGNTVQPDSQVVNFSNGESYIYQKPHAFQWAGRLPHDMVQFGKTSFKKENLVTVGAILAVTGAMVLVDQEMLDGTKLFAKNIGVSADNGQKKIANFSVGKTGHSLALPIFVPTNFNTGMYFLGDGLTHVTAMTGFWVYGKVAHNYRALQTSSQLLECLFATGIVTQTLKHLTGRESPYTATAPGGKWRFFPNQKEYATHVPHYDAFPSGHLATLIGTVTIIADNYPEYRFVRPVGYTLCGMLAFAMVNNGVHWISDYPLGLAIGYTISKAIVADGRKTLNDGTPKKMSMYHRIKPDLIFPSPTLNGTQLTALWQF